MKQDIEQAHRWLSLRFQLSIFNSLNPVALKKSELYSSLWSGCDELRGGMDASQYKDYVLVILAMQLTRRLSHHWRRQIVCRTCRILMMQQNWELGENW
jgi:HsdM N-terminal domain